MAVPFAAWLNSKPPEFQAHFLRIAGIDSIHDFYKLERADWGDDAKDAIREDISSALRAGVNLDVATVMKPGNRALNPTGDFEADMVKEYEKLLPSYLFAANSPKPITYEDILADKYTDFLKGFGEGGGMLHIQPNSGVLKFPYDKSQRNKIGNFVLRYLFPGDAPLAFNEYGLTADGSPPVPAKIFYDLGMYQAEYPQNIADSAGTSFKVFNSEPHFIFPDGATKVRSNIFTRDLVDIEFEKKTFGGKDPFGFTIKLTEKANLAQPTTMTFSSESCCNSGPSVNELIDAILNPANPTPPALTQIGGIFRNDPAKKKLLLLDLKRMGDYEQVAAASADNKVVFTTTDHMCALYARMNRQPCIWGSGNMIRVYRFAKDRLPPWQESLKTDVAFAQEHIKRIELLESFATWRGEIESAKNDIARGVGSYFAPSAKPLSESTIQFIDQGGSGENSDFKNQAKQLELAMAVTTYLMRIKMEDALKHVDTVVASIATSLDKLAAIKDVNILKQIYTGLMNLSYNTRPVPPWSQDPVSPFHLKTQGIDVTDVSTQLADIFSVAAPVFDIKMMGKTLFGGDMFRQTPFGVTAMNPGASNVAFEVSFARFLGFYSAIREVIGVLNPARVGRMDTRKKAQLAYDSLIKERDTILDTFKDKETIETVKNMIPVTHGFTVEQLQAQVFKMTTELFAAAPKPVTQQAVAEEPMTAVGGAPGDGETQFQDLSALFYKVCGTVSMRVESILSRHVFSKFPEHPYDDAWLQAEADKLTPVELAGLYTQKANGEAIVSIMSDVAYTFERELLSIRENAMDSYGREYTHTPTDKIIAWILSFSRSEDMVFESIPSLPVGPPDAIGKRDRTLVEDIGGLLLLTEVHPQIRTAILFTMLDNVLREKKNPYFTGISNKAEAFPVKRFSIDTLVGWESLSNTIHSGLMVVNKFFGAPVENSAPAVKRARRGGSRTWRQRSNARRTYRR